MDNLSKRFDELNSPQVWTNSANKEMSSMKNELKTVLETAKQAANNVDTSILKERMKAAWSGVVNKKGQVFFP